MTEPSEVEKFYIDRINNFDAERRRISSYTNLIKRNNNESHTLHWQERQNADIALNSSHELEELAGELHKILDQTHEARVELENLIDNQRTMKSQIDLLSQLSRPVQHDVTYFFEDRFAQTSRARGSNPKKDSNTSITVPAQSKMSVHLLGGQKNMPVPKQPKTGEVVQLELKRKSQNSLLSSRFQEFRSQVHILEAGMMQNIARNTETLDPDIQNVSALISENDKYDHQCFLSVVELLKLRARVMVSEREEVEELDSLRQDRIKSAKFERDLRTRLEVDKKTSREHLLKAKLSIEADYAEQLRELTDKCTAIQKQERRIEKGKKTKSVQAIERLENQVAHSQGRYEKLRRRNALEMEGYNNETAILRLRLAHVEKIYSSRLRQSSRKRTQHPDPGPPNSRSADVSPISD